jgi:hypothetical protein
MIGFPTPKPGASAEKSEDISECIVIVKNYIVTYAKVGTVSISTAT